MTERIDDLTRRRFLRNAAAPAAAAAFLSPVSRGAQAHVPGSRSASAAIHLPVLAQPDLVFVFLGDAEAERFSLARHGNEWTGGLRASGVRVLFAPEERQAAVRLQSPAAAVQRVHLRWNAALPQEAIVLGDAWERGYGDLQWLPLEAERGMPWYALLQYGDHRGSQTAGMGVKTGTAAFAFWQADAAGVSLWLDVRNGGNGVQLGGRVLDAATIVTCNGHPGESAFAVTQRLCRAMAEGTVVPQQRGGAPLDTVYGSNDWYYAYGRNTHDGILRDADLVRSLAPAGKSKPFTIIDDGYQDRTRFPSLPRLASEIRSRGVTPGIWVRPLRAANGTARNLLLPEARWNSARGDQPVAAYDPTIPEALAAVTAVFTEACGWGYDLIKHDFTTYELLGQWGSQMGASPAQGSWHLHDRSRTNAEVITILYRAIRQACGTDRILLGCNTVGHLSVGLFDLSRGGDDVSGRQWERTRRMGVNTLAFRLPQHKIFYGLDADCIAVTPEVPWSMTRQWLQAVANSGTVLLISADPKTIGPEQRQALRDAFERCAEGSRSEPMDWTVSRTPAIWTAGGHSDKYRWIAEEGASPFPIGVQRGPD